MAASSSLPTNRIVGRDGNASHSGAPLPAKLGSTACSTAKVFPSPAGPWMTPRARWRAMSATALVVRARASVWTVDSAGQVEEVAAGHRRRPTGKGQQIGLGDPTQTVRPSRPARSWAAAAGR